VPLRLRLAAMALQGAVVVEALRQWT